MNVVGIDVGKKSLHVSLLTGEQVYSKEFENTVSGLTSLKRWLSYRKISPAHVCLEASGGWSEGVALSLHEHGFLVSIVNPSRIKAFAQSELLRTKTDRVDAALIARFCRMHCPAEWVPPSPESQALQAFVRRQEVLIRLRADELNRSEAPMIHEEVKASIEATILSLNSELARIEKAIEQLFSAGGTLQTQRDLLTSIPGIGKTTAARILGEMPNIARFRDSKAVAAFAGLSPRHYESGSIRWPSRLSKSGNASLRRALYFPAVTAIRFNPIFRNFAARLKERGKSNMTIIAAVMRKLLVLSYAMLKSGSAFDMMRAGA